MTRPRSALRTFWARPFHARRAPTEVAISSSTSPIPRRLQAPSEVLVPPRDPARDEYTPSGRRQARADRPNSGASVGPARRALERNGRRDLLDFAALRRGTRRLGFPQDQGQQHSTEEHAGDRQQRAAIGPGCVLDPRGEQRAGDTRHAPRGQDRAVVGTHMAGAEIFGDDRRHRAESAAEAQQHDGVGGRYSEKAVNSVHQPEHHDLNSEYQRERADGPDAVGYGAPEKAAERIEQRDSAVRRRDN